MARRIWREKPENMSNTIKVPTFYFSNVTEEKQQILQILHVLGIIFHFNIQHENTNPINS